jgi:hypothetical protein
MFINVPESRMHIPSALLSEGEECHLVIRNQLFSPWFIATGEIVEHDYKLPQTFFVSTVDWLEAVLESSEIAGFLKIQMMIYLSESGEWRSNDVLEVWQEQKRDDKSYQRLALLKNEGGYFFADNFFEEPCGITPLEPAWTMLYGTKAHE